MNYCENAVTISGDEYLIGRLVEKKFNLDFINPTPLEALQDGTWGDWRRKNWGTTWGIDEETFIVVSRALNKITITFQSGWDAPMGIYQTLIDRGLSVTAHYIDYGNNYMGVWENGEVVEDSFHTFDQSHPGLYTKITGILGEVKCFADLIKGDKNEVLFASLIKKTNGRSVAA